MNGEYFVCIKCENTVDTIYPGRLCKTCFSEIYPEGRYW